LLNLYARDVRDVAQYKNVALIDVFKMFEDYGSQPGRSILRTASKIVGKKQGINMRYHLSLSAVIVMLLTTSASGGQDTSASGPDSERIPFLLTYPNLDNPDGEVLLDNEHVVVQRFVVPPGKWEGLHAHPGNQVYVHVVGGVWSGRAGGKPTYNDTVSKTGSVGWMERIPLSAGHESGNTGDAPIDLIWVTLKGEAPIAPEVEHKPLVYPNIPMELLLENDRVIVQRVQVEPGQWEGVHSHPGNQVFIHIKGGTWAGRMAGVQSATKTVRADGAVGWMDAIDLSEQHESGNAGDTTIDLVWVTLK
jgi:quercetin dioxygenase-like cupin family protein